MSVDESACRRQIMSNKLSAVVRKGWSYRPVRLVAGFLGLATCYAIGGQAVALVLGKQAAPAERSARTPDEIRAALTSMARVDVPLARGTADVLVAVFNDYQCDTCSLFHRTMEQAVKRLSEEERARVMWRRVDFPLDASCNPLIKSARHESACEAAIAARLARLSGREREFSTWLFDQGDALTTEGIWQRAESLGVERTSASYEAALAEVRSDVAIGLGLGVKATPTLFINGARFQGSPELEALLILVRHELAAVASQRR